MSISRSWSSARAIGAGGRSWRSPSGLFRTEATRRRRSNPTSPSIAVTHAAFGRWNAAAPVRASAVLPPPRLSARGSSRCSSCGARSCRARGHRHRQNLAAGQAGARCGCVQRPDSVLGATTSTVTAPLDRALVRCVRLKVVPACGGRMSPWLVFRTTGQPSGNAFPHAGPPSLARAVATGR